MRSEAEWEEIRKHQEIGNLATSLVKLVNLKLHGRYAELVIPPYAFGTKQWELDKKRVIEAAQCVIRAIGPRKCKFIERYAAKRYGLLISPELAKSDPYAAASYVAHWGFLWRVAYYHEPPWGKRVMQCGGDAAASRILGFTKPEPPRQRGPDKQP